MTDLPDPGTDPIASEGGYGFLGRIVGLPLLEQVILGRLDRIERLLTANAADNEALVAALATLRTADVTVDKIEPTVTTTAASIARTHTGHRDGNPGASSKGK